MPGSRGRSGWCQARARHRGLEARRDWKPSLQRTSNNLNTRWTRPRAVVVVEARELRREPAQPRHPERLQRHDVVDRLIPGVAEHRAARHADAAAGPEEKGRIQVFRRDVAGGTESARYGSRERVWPTVHHLAPRPE